MQNSQQLDQEIQGLLDFVGGQVLDGSGFENEQPEPDYSPDSLGEEE